jgi:hypothetical protein
VSKQECHRLYNNAAVQTVFAHEALVLTFFFISAGVEDWWQGFSAVASAVNSL